MTILMEVSPNIDNGTLDPDPTILETPTDEVMINMRNSRSRNNSVSKMNKKSELLKEKIESKKKGVIDKRKKKPKNKVDIETERDSSFNGHSEDYNDSEMDVSLAENPEYECASGDKDKWFLRTIEGTDLTSRPAVVSCSGKYIFINSQDRVLVYSSKSGQLMRQLNTGQILAIQKTNIDEEISSDLGLPLRSILQPSASPHQDRSRN